MSHPDGPRRAAMAIPGDLNSLTGGYIYDLRLIAGLRRLGRDMRHLQLGDSFPDPTPFDNDKAARCLADVPADCPVIMDGLALGVIDQAALQGMSAPIVGMIHHPLALETGLAPDRRNHLYRTERANLAFAAHVIVPSPHTAALLVSEYGVAENRITIAQPGTDQPTGQPNPEDPPLILSVGIQVPRKGHDILLQALAALVDLPWRAVIVGAAYDPLYAEELSQLRCNLNLTDRVHFTGQISDNALTRLYHQATVFALATRHEGYGIVFNEAMAHGLPIISCDVGAVSGTLAPDASLLTPPDDPRAFAQELNRILDDSSLRAGMAEASSRAGRDLPGWDSTARLVDTALTRVCSEARVRG